jgi:hypothetical protein
MIGDSINRESEGLPEEYFDDFDPDYADNSGCCECGSCNRDGRREDSLYA